MFLLVSRLSRCGSQISVFAAKNGEQIFILSKLFGWISNFPDSCNPNFWSSRSDDGKRYFQKLDFPNSPSLLPKVHLTCKSILNDKHLEKYSSYCKVLWMSILQLAEIFILIHCLIGAEHKNMGFCGENDNIGHYGPIWMRSDPKTLEGTFSSSDRIDQKLRRKILTSWIDDMAGTHSENKFVMSVWSCVNGHFTTKPHWDRVKLVNVLSWFMFCPWLGRGGGARSEEFLVLFGTPPFGISVIKKSWVNSTTQKSMAAAVRLCGGQRGVGSVVHARRQWVLHCSEIMLKARAHRPARWVSQGTYSRPVILGETPCGSSKSPVKEQRLIYCQPPCGMPWESAITEPAGCFLIKCTMGWLEDKRRQPFCAEKTLADGAAPFRVTLSRVTRRWNWLHPQGAPIRKKPAPWALAFFLHWRTNFSASVEAQCANFLSH